MSKLAAFILRLAQTSLIMRSSPSVSTAYYVANRFSFAADAYDP